MPNSFCSFKLKRISCFSFICLAFIMFMLNMQPTAVFGYCKICSSCFVCIFIRICWKCQRNELSAHLQRNRSSFLIETKFSVRNVIFILIAKLCFVISSEFYINKYRNIVYVKNKLRLCE